MKKISIIFLAIIMIVGCGKEQTIKHPLVKNTQKKETKKDDTQKQVDVSNSKINVPLFVETRSLKPENYSNESLSSDTNQEITTTQEEKTNITNDSESNIIFPNERDEQIPSNRAPNSSNLQYYALWPKLLERYGNDEIFNKNSFIFDHYAFVTRSGIIGTESGNGANKTVSLYDLDADKYLWHKKIGTFDVIVPGKILMYTFEGDKANQRYFIDLLTGQELWAKKITVTCSDGTYFTGVQYKDEKYNKVIGLIDTGEIIVTDASKYLSDEEPIVVKKRVFQDDQGKEHIWDYEKTYSKVEQRLAYFEEDNKLLVASNFCGNDYLFNVRMIDTISGKVDWLLKADLNFFHTVDDLKLLNIEKNGDDYLLYIDGYTGSYGEDSDSKFFQRINKNGDAFELNEKYKFINHYKGNLIVRDDKQIDAYNFDGQKIKTLVKPDSKYLAYNSKVCAGKIFLFTKSLTCYDGVTLEELWDKKFDSNIHPELTDIIVSDRIYTIIRRYVEENYSNEKSVLFEVDPTNGETIDKIVFDDPGNEFQMKPSILSTQHSIIIHSKFGLHVFKDKSNQKAIKPSKRFIGDYYTCAGPLSPNEKYSLENTTGRDILVTQRIFSYNIDDDATYKVKVPAKKKIDIPLSQFKQLSDEGLYKIVISFENDFDQVMISCGQRCGD